MKKKFSEIRVRDILLVDFPIQEPGNHLQSGRRPALVLLVPKPEILGTPRFDFIEVVPISKFTEQKRWWVEKSPILYPVVSKGVSRFKYDSIFLLDQAHPVYSNQIVRYLGELDFDQYDVIRKNIQIIQKLRVLPSPGK
jgi:mRNA-degrading endonuclease toxin of MazEF toxin-antitoxin module